MYRFGQGVTQDYVQSLAWFRKAAENGAPSAQHNVGLFYTQGWGVAQDYGKAAYWFERAANQGYVPSMFGLGLIYENGDGTAKDTAVAYKWYSLAVLNAGDDGTRTKAAAMKDLMAGTLTAQQIAEIDNQVKTWKPTPEPEVGYSVKRLRKPTGWPSTIRSWPGPDWDGRRSAHGSGRCARS